MSIFTLLPQAAIRKFPAPSTTTSFALPWPCESLSSALNSLTTVSEPARCIPAEKMNVPSKLQVLLSVAISGFIHNCNLSTEFDEDYTTLQQVR